MLELTFRYVMDLTQIRSFAHVAERGTIAAAAAALEFTPPAVSQHVAKLEANLGAILFDRSGRRLQLTDAGRALLPIALEMLDVEVRGRQAVAAPSTVPNVVLAGFASAIATFVVPVLATISSQMTLTVVESEDAEALRELRLGEYDLELTQEYDAMPVDRDPRLTFTPLARDRLRLVLPASLDAATSVEDLGSMPWLVNGRNTRCAEATERVLRAHAIAPVISGVVADNDTLLELVAAGHGVSIVPELLLTGPRPGVVVADQDLHIARTVLAVHRTGSSARIAPLLLALRPEPTDVSTATERRPA